MLTRLTRYVAPAAVLLTLAVAPAVANDLETVNREAERLRGELAELQLAQASGAGAYTETRLAAFEQELRNLTGMIEQLGYQQNQLSQRLDRMQADYEYRLSTLEGGEPPAGGGAAPNGGSSSGSSSTGGSSSGGGSSASGSGTTAVTPQDDVKIIGTLSQDQQVQDNNYAAPQQLGAANQGGGQVASLPGGSAKEQYDYAFGLLRKADYPGAEAALKQFIEANPSDPLVANAKYWLGETYYVRGDYTAAASAFGLAYQDHPQGGKAVDSLLKLGLSLSLLGRGSDACAVFGELETRFPEAPANILQRSKQERSRLSC